MLPADEVGAEVTEAAANVPVPVAPAVVVAEVSADAVGAGSSGAGVTVPVATAPAVVLAAFLPAARQKSACAPPRFRCSSFILRNIALYLLLHPTDLIAARRLIFWGECKASDARCCCRTSRREQKSTDPWRCSW